MISIAAGCALATANHVVPTPALGIGQNCRVTTHHQREKTEAVGVICYDEEIQRARKPGRLAAGSGDFLAFGKAVSFSGAETAAESPSIH